MLVWGEPSAAGGSSLSSRSLTSAVIIDTKRGSGPGVAARASGAGEGSAFRLTITRGPRVSIPPATGGRESVPLSPEDIDRYAKQGWVDLRLVNFERWRARLRGIDPPDVVTYGSAALDVRTYPGDKFVPGDIVGWIFTNEEDQGMVGRRLF